MILHKSHLITQVSVRSHVCGIATVNVLQEYGVIGRLNHLLGAFSRFIMSSLELFSCIQQIGEN